METPPTTAVQTARETETERVEKVPEFAEASPAASPAEMIPAPPTTSLTPSSVPTASPIPFKPEAVPARSWWARLGPDVRAAILVSFVTTGLGAVNGFVPGLGFVFTTPFAVIAYYVQGILTGKLASQDTRYEKKDFVRLGVYSGFWSGVVISTLFLVFVFFAFTFLTVGTILALIPTFIAARLGDIFLNIIFTTIGSWLYGRTGGKGVLGISIAVVSIGIMVACGLILLVLVVAGYSISQFL
ncbi:MAG: hypothetical protein ACE5GO_02995 [Anaerolineales bacterium]